MANKKFEMTVDGKKIKFEEKSHAAIFRNFWNHFMSDNLEKTIETIDLVNIRTSDFDMFIAKNGSKKKNIELVEGERWIYTHLTPAAMEKTYEKFLKGWAGEYVKPEDKVEAKPEESAEQKPAEEPEKKLTAREKRAAKAAEAAAKLKKEKEEKAKKAAEKKAAKAKNVKQMTAEDLQNLPEAE